MHRLNYDKKDLGLAFLLPVGMTLIASMVLAWIFGAESTGWKFWLMQALYTLMIGSTAFIYAGLSKTKVFTATKLDRAPRYAHFLWGCLAVVFLIFCMTPLNNWILDGIEATGLRRPGVELEGNVYQFLLVACLLPCLTEEIVFRGTVAQSLEGSSNKLGALALSGALFALFHANPAQTIHQFVLGAFLTLLVYRSGSLWTSIIVHFFNNALVVALTYTPVGTDEFWNVHTNKAWVLALFFIGLVGFATCVVGYLKTTKSVWGARKDEQAQADSKYGVACLVYLGIGVFFCMLLWILSLFSPS